MKKRILLLSGAILCSSLLSSYSATLLGLWTFDGTSGSSVTTVSDIANPGTADLTALKSAGNVAPVYGSSTPGSQLSNPLTTSTYSLGSLAVSIYGQGVTTGATTALNSANGFTLQLSLNLASTAGKGNVIASRYDSGTSTGWRILSNSAGKIYVQFFSNGQTSTLWSSGSNYFDDTWHSLALTFDPTTNRARLSLDGVWNSLILTAGSQAADIEANGLALTVGTNVGTGNGTSYFSAMSYTDSVLVDGQLMTVVPEPSVIGYSLIGLAFLFLPRWRRRLACTHFAD